MNGFASLIKKEADLAESEIIDQIYMVALKITAIS